MDKVTVIQADREDEWYALSARADQDTGNEGEDMAAIGIRDGYSEAVQTLDVLTGGDGEYRYCTIPSDSHCPDPPAMIRRIVARQSLAREPATADVDADVELIEKLAGGDFETRHFRNSLAGAATRLRAALSRAAPSSEQTTARIADGYSDAFYDLAKLMGISASTESPSTVWLRQMLPRLQAAFTPSSEPAIAEGERQSTVAFVQEWLMSSDHAPTKWDRDFAAAIDARVIAASAGDLATRFCAAPLPDDVCADQCATVQGPGRYGTHLMTVDQATRVFTAALSRAAPSSGHAMAEGEREGCIGSMDPKRATYFLERFKREEKWLGPHEQWAIDYTIGILAALATTPPTTNDAIPAGDYVAGPVHRLDHEEDEVWSAEVQVTGGYYVAAEVYGSTEAEARLLQATIIAALSAAPSAPATAVGEDDQIMIPREPTQAMMDAGLYHSNHDAEWADVNAMWKGMFDAVTLDGGTSVSAAGHTSATRVDGNDIWEALFGIMRGNVPDEMTEEVCSQLAAALSAAPSAPATEAGEEALRPMSEAPKDRSYILARYNNPSADERNQHYNGRWFVIRHEGITPSDFDLGWGLFPGYGGVPDICFDGWLPLPAAPTDQVKDGKGGVA